MAKVSSSGKNCQSLIASSCVNKGPIEFVVRLKIWAEAPDMNAKYDQLGLNSAA